MTPFSRINNFLSTWGFRISLLIYCAVLCVFFYSRARQVGFYGWVDHTHEVISTINGIEDSLEEANSSESVFLLRRSNASLRGYFTSTDGLPDRLNHLKQLVSDNPSQAENAAQLEKLVVKHVEDLAELLSDVRKGIVNNRSQLRALEQKVEIHRLVIAMSTIERDLLQKREDRANTNGSFIGSVVIFSVFVALAIMLVGNFSTQRALRDNRNQTRFLRSVFDCMSCGIVVVDASGKTTHFNPAAEAMIGANLLDTTAKQRIELGVFKNAETGEPLRGEDSAIGRSLKGAPINGFEVITYPDKKEGRVLNVDARPILNHEDQIVGSIALFTDVTDRKTFERDAKEAREAAIAGSRMKSDFLANMSHEIRTPMNGVLGMATLLLDGKLNDEQQNHVKTIKNSADALLTLINQILDHSKIEAGKLELLEADFNLHECVEGVAAMFRYMARSKNIELIVDIESGTPEFMRGDQARLRQILVNLVGNALKFTEKGFVRLSLQPVVCSSSIHKVLFEIKDTGPGIAKAAQDNIFERYSRANPSAQALRGGTGLGLMISREFVKLMNGEIGLESLEGFGSRFWFTAEFGLAEKVVHAPLSRLHVRKTYVGHVLIAEDQLVNQTVIRKFLELFGITCEIVANGALALDAYKRTQFDMVLMDCQMPVMDGYAATTAIRESEANMTEPKHVPIVALTAEGRSGDRERCYKVGMDDFLTKPIEIDRLQTVLDQRLAKKAHNSLFKPSALEKLDGFESKGRPLAEVLVDDYLDTTPEIIRSMQIAEKDQDFDALATFAHALRSSSLTLGLETVGRLCEEIEDNPKRPSQVLPLREAWTDGCSQLKWFLNSRNSQVA